MKPGAWKAVLLPMTPNMKKKQKKTFIYECKGRTGGLQLFLFLLYISSDTNALDRMSFVCFFWSACL